GTRIPNRGPSLKPLHRNKNAMAWGVGAPWNLVLSLALGTWLMLSHSSLGIEYGLFIANYIMGPLFIVFSFIAFSGVFRTIRFITILFGRVLLLAPCATKSASGVGL